MAQSGMVSLLECPVCLDTFTDPRTLTPCLHTLCYGCLQSHITHTGQNGQFQCPQCRKALLIPDDGADGFPKNFFVNNCIDVIVKPETGARSKTGQSASRGVKHNLCSNSEGLDDCGDRETFCLECCEYYCNVCSRVHRRSKMSRNHILVPLRDLTDDMLREAMSKSQAPRCPKHADKVLELYCSTCEQAVCYLCSRTEHPSHTCKYISDVDQSLKTELNAVMASLQRLVRESQTRATKIKQSHQGTEDSISNVRDTANRAFQRMQQMLRKKAKDIDDKICRIKEEGVSTFTTEYKNQTLHTDLLQSLLRFVQDLLKTGTVYNRLARLPDVRNRLKEFKSSPTDGATHPETPSSAALVIKQLDGLVVQEEFNLGSPRSAGPILEIKQLCTVRENKTRVVRQKLARSSTKVGQGREVIASADTPSQAARVRLFQSGKPELTVLLYRVYDLFWFSSTLSLLQDAASAVLSTVECDVTWTLETQLQPVRADSLQIEAIECLNDDINSVGNTYSLTETNTAGRHLVLLHKSRGGSVAKTLASLGDHSRLFNRVIQYDWTDANSRTAAINSLADYYRSVCQQSNAR